MIFDSHAYPVSIDLETLGLQANAPIIQIGAVQFNRDGGIISQFFREIRPQGQTAADMNTLKWWLDQGDGGTATIRCALASSVSLEEALQQFSGWLHSLEALSDPDSLPGRYTGPVMFRGNKDMSWLENAYDRHGMELPFMFQEVHEQRQFMRAANHMGLGNQYTAVSLQRMEYADQRVTPPHHALSDAIWQAQCAAYAVKYMDAVNDILKDHPVDKFIPYVRE